MIHSKFRRSILPAVVAVAMGGVMLLSPMLASARDMQDKTAGSVPEWAVDDGADLQEYGPIAQAVIPGMYDLRNDGLVTPVKFQNPWGSCWAFAGTAAAETSILSAYGSTYEETGLDLSEKHLTYFALQPISESEDPTQAGEGLYTIDTSPNAAYDTGGAQIYVTSLYSQGAGPMPESLFPYRGKEGILEAEYYEAHPEALDEETRSQIAAAAAGSNMTYDEFMESRAKSMSEQTGTPVTAEELFELLRNSLMEAAIDEPTYSKYDDWTISAASDSGISNRFVSGGVVLKNGNVLPEYWGNPATDENPSEESKIARRDYHALRRPWRSLLGGSRGVRKREHEPQPVCLHGNEYKPRCGDRGVGRLVSRGQLCARRYRRGTGCDHASRQRRLDREEQLGLRDGRDTGER